METGTNKAESTCIVAFGGCTALGHTMLTSAAAVRAGITAFGEHPYMIDRTGEPMVVARAPWPAEELLGPDRLIELSLPAAKETLNCLVRLRSQFPPISVVVGLPAERPGLPKELSRRILERLKDLVQPICRVSVWETISAGHSAGLMAMEAGWRKIQDGQTEFCLVGGVDSYLEPETLEWLDACEQLHGGDNAWGFIPGEAAGFCLLASPRAAENYQLSQLGRVLKVASAREQNLIKTEKVCLGKGLTDAVSNALAALPQSVKVDHTICDMNGEAYRAEEFGFTMVRMSERFISASDFSAPADCWGDVGAASGPLFVNLALIAGKKRYTKGPHVLIWTSSEGGERTAALLLLDNQGSN